MSNDALTRRQFLMANGVTDTGSTTVGLAQPAGRIQCPDRGTHWPLSSVSIAAMASEFTILLNVGQLPQGTSLAIRALECVPSLEQRLSVFREDSELSQINHRAETRDVSVAADLFELLLLAKRLHESTDGAFDITASPLWRLWGFHRRQGRRPPEDEIQKTLRRVGSQFIKLDPIRRSIRFLQQGMELNLGGIGKGYALDCVTRSLVENGVPSTTVHSDGSSIVAIGSRFDSPYGGWCVNVPHPWRPHQHLGTIILRNRALATSGAATQSFHDHGVRYGHIFDPRSGMPVSGIHTATALAPTAAEADALATAFYVMGVAATQSYCHHHPEVAAVLVTPGTTHREVNIIACNLQDDDYFPSATNISAG